MRSRSTVLYLALGVLTATAGGGHAARQARDAKIPEPVSWYSGKIVHNAFADDISVATPHPSILISFIGAEHAGKDAARWRLGRFRFAYAWEPKADAEARFQEWRTAVDSLMDFRAAPFDSLNRVTWTPAQTAPAGFATIAEPTARAGAHFLHILLQEPGWDSYPYPGAIHPMALQGAHVFEPADGARNVNVWLLQVRQDSPP